MRKKSKLENIEHFKRLHYYGADGELTSEKAESLGLEFEPYNSLLEQAYQVKYDLSEDWAKEAPEWDDVKESYMIGVEDGFEFILDIIKKENINNVDDILDIIKKYLKQ